MSTKTSDDSALGPDADPTGTLYGANGALGSDGALSGPTLPLLSDLEVLS